MAERREQARRTLLAVAAVLPALLARPGACGMSAAALAAQLTALLPDGVPALLFPLGWWIWLGLTALAGL